MTKKEKCFSFRNVNSLLRKTEEHHMESDEEEEDYRMMLHLHDVFQKSNVVIKANDADVLIILLGNIQKFQQKNIWMEFGLITNNTLRYINIKLQKTSCISYLYEVRLLSCVCW